MPSGSRSSYRSSDWSGDFYTNIKMSLDTELVTLATVTGSVHRNTSDVLKDFIPVRHKLKNVFPKVSLAFSQGLLFN